MNLDPFDRIAWDFDGTLIDHPKSPFMHQYIREHPEKTHIIVTFRTHGMEKRIFREMLRSYPQAPDETHFDDVLNISDRAWMRFTEAQTERRLGERAGPPTPWELYYVHWKGLVCKLKNLQLLIDDKPSDVTPGCEKYGIIFCNPDDL